MAKKRDHLVKEMRELACCRQPGSRFFTIRELMKRFSVSQLLVYKALDQLKADGLLVTHDGNELYVTEESALRQHLRLPSILVAIPHWKSWVTDQVIRLVAEPKPLCPGYRTELIEYDPLKAVPDVLPIEREKAVGQGPHQGAQKSSRTFLSEFITSFWKLFLLILIADILLSSLFSFVTSLYPEK